MKLFAGSYKELTIWPLALFFGWLLSFPFFGPLLHHVAVYRNMDAAYLGFIFSFFQALGFLLGGILRKYEIHWDSLMVWGGGFCLGLSIVMWFADPGLWPLGMGALGAASSLYVIGWSYPFTLWTGQARQIPFMAGAMLWSNIIYVGVYQLIDIIPLGILYHLGTLLLAVVLWVAVALKKLKIGAGEITPENESRNLNPNLPLPGMLILALCLFIFGFDVHGGLMYNVIQPFYADLTGAATFYRFLPYIAIMIYMWKRGEWVKRSLMTYLSASLMGLAFIFFALLEDSLPGYFVTETLINGAFAFLDLFIWTTLGAIACVYGRPARVFGFGLAANVGAILVGGLLGKYILLPDNNVQVFTALFATMIIFITFLIIPWLEKQLEKGVEIKKYQKKVDVVQDAENKSYAEMIDCLPGSNSLTPREYEIAALLLSDLTNNKIAESLFISDNTLKTHLKSIYRKLNVANKKELRSLALNNQQVSELYPKPTCKEDSS